MTPDAWFILLASGLAGASYLLWVGGWLPRARALLVLLALLAFALSVVLHGALVSREAAQSESDWGAPRDGSRPIDHDLATS
jgi:hypothetical protein